MEFSVFNLLIPGFILGFILGLFWGRYSMSPYALLLTNEQQRQLGTAVANRMPSGLSGTLLLLPSVGLMPVVAISIAYRSSVLFSSGFLAWIIIVAPVAVIFARTMNRIVGEELEGLKSPAT